MKKRNWIWLAITALISASALWIMIQQSKTFSAESFWHCICSASPWWIGAALAFMLGTIVFEGLGMRSVSAGLGYRRPLSSALAYSAADLFCSAITPSSTGGQPAALYCMHKDNIPVTTASIALLLNLTMYTLSNLIIGLLPLVLRFRVFLSFNTASKVLIIIGSFIHLGLIAFYTILTLRADGAVRFAQRLLPLLKKLHLIRSVEDKRQKLQKTEADFRCCAQIVRSKPRLLMRSFVCNMAQRICLVMITVSVYLATGGTLNHFVDVFAAQGFIITGSGTVPLPGAVGVSDYLYLDVFRGYVTDTVSMDILTRGISFYLCMALCALFTWAWLLYKKRKEKTV